MFKASKNGKQVSLLSPCLLYLSTVFDISSFFVVPGKCNCSSGVSILSIDIYLLFASVFEGKIPGVELSLPPSHTALSGDLHVEIASSSFPPLLLQVSRLEGTSTQALTTIQVLPEARALSLNKTIVKIPCGYFSRGGTYFILLKKQPTNYTTEDEQSSVITRSLDVRWPMPQLSLTPEHVQTYPERPVMAILEFPEVVCPPVTDSPASAIPEFWLELQYCGHSLLTCDNLNDNLNQSHVPILYSEQVRGFPGRRVLTLRCELFGLAGHYALLLRPTAPTPALPHTAAYVKADWSDQFVFNVHARSIFPCEVHSGGIKVLFQYPSCILASGDRVRLFARLRANVASLTPPTSLEYVAEQRITRSQHSLNFDCDLFTERYVEYCFVYVSQAITGAVADVRMDCVPTLPVSEFQSGGWGPWSSWTPCTSTCMRGTRSRYRFCDSPPPQYGAKFCEGPRVQTEKCGLDFGNSWECIYGASISTDIAADLPEVQAEMSPFCRCGCVVHLGPTKPKRLIATSSQSCPGRTFWLVQADEDHTIQFRVEQFRLPCGSQWLKVRDGSSLSANLLADLSGAPDVAPTVVNSSGSNLLLEFSNEDPVSSHMCGGGFVAQAIQISPIKSNVTGLPIAQGVGIIPTAALKLTAVHIAAIFFLSGLIVATALLGAQYLCRYRKYHIAQAEDQDSLADPTASCGSLPIGTRVSSSTTLLSEVISLTRLRPMKPRHKHNRLRESMDCEQNGEEQEVTLAKEEESLSASSIVTLGHPEATATGAAPPVIKKEEITTTCSLPSSPQPHQFVRRSSSKSDKDFSVEKDSSSVSSRRFSNVSTATLTNVRAPSKPNSKSDPGCYSPAASMISRATIRQTNEKESKEKRNREKLLAGPLGSEFSIVGPDGDLEMDYYDYNVVNAGAAPGSYLGMDPAFLVWIPPLDESGEILKDLDEVPSYAEMKPKQYIDPGSNRESPEEELLLPKRTRSLSEGAPKSSPLINQRRKRVHPITDVNKANSNGGESERTPLMKNEPASIVSIQLHEFPKCKLGKSLPDVGETGEKETKVEKSPVDSNILNEIKFVDDDEDDFAATDNQCNIELSYQDSNILSSS